MVISIDFCGIQRSITRTDKIDISLFDHARVTDVLKLLRDLYPDLPLDEKTVTATVNLEISSMDRVLKADDKVSFLPHIGGG
jgi:molybdopterin converting factor small subunit